MLERVFVGERGEFLKAETVERKEMFSGMFARPHFVFHSYPLGCCDYVTIYPCFVLHTKFFLKWSNSFFNSPLDV